MLTMYENARVPCLMRVKAGASGYVLKDVSGRNC